MVLSHVRQCFSIDLDSKAVENKGTHSLKRAVDHNDEEGTKDALKKSKQSVDLKTPTSQNKMLTIKLKQPAAVSIHTFCCKCMIIYNVHLLFFQKKNDPKPELVKKASVFGDSIDSDEAEEMPPEARMRMKNIGRYHKHHRFQQHNIRFLMM